MKVTATRSFQPITLTVELASQEEVDTLLKLAQYPLSITAILQQLKERGNPNLARFQRVIACRLLRAMGRSVVEAQ